MYSLLQTRKPVWESICVRIEVLRKHNGEVNFNNFYYLFCHLDFNDEPFYSRYLSANWYFLPYLSIWYLHQRTFSNAYSLSCNFLFASASCNRFVDSQIIHRFMKVYAIWFYYVPLLSMYSTCFLIFIRLAYLLLYLTVKMSIHGVSVTKYKKRLHQPECYIIFFTDSSHPRGHKLIHL